MPCFVKQFGSFPFNGGSGVMLKSKKGGDVTYLAAADIDYLDPGQDYYTFGFMVQFAVNRPLYSFKPDNSTVPVPDVRSTYVSFVPSALQLGSMAAVLDVRRSGEPLGPPPPNAETYTLPPLSYATRGSAET